LQFQKAAQIYKLSLRGHPDDHRVRSRLILTLGYLGDRTVMLRELDRLPREPGLGANWLFEAGLGFAVAGDDDRALGILRSAVDRGYSLGTVWLQHRALPGGLVECLGREPYPVLMAEFDGIHAKLMETY
jgi:hypothetical protein